VIDDLPYHVPLSELWLGTHPSGEAQVKIDNNWSESLTAHIARNPADILGSYNVSNWGNQLPFLLKVRHFILCRKIAKFFYA